VCVGALYANVLRLVGVLTCCICCSVYQPHWCVVICNRLLEDYCSLKPGEVQPLYVVCGDDDAGTRHIRIVPSEDLDETIKQFAQVHFQHVYR
jgi:hypothetical protein